ncbi:hypothetical protein [Microbulbifer agarilyticus]
MSIEKLHKIVGWLCLGLSSVGFIIGGLEESQAQTDKGAKIILFLLGCYLPFWCLYCIKIGRIVFLFNTGGEPISKEKEAYYFWPAIGVVLILAIALLMVPFK